jgi:arginine N-succinyltransferase
MTHAEQAPGAHPLQPTARTAASTWAVRPATPHDAAALAALYGAPRAVPRPDDAVQQVLLAEHRDSGQLDAALCLRRHIGLALPRYWYHVGATVHAAPELQLFHRQRTLVLGNDHTGASELADLAWRRDGVSLAEQAAALHSLVASALVLAAQQRGQPGEQLIVELPGVRDAAGQSPFWQGLGRHFYSGDPQDAERQFGADWPSHVAALLPRLPVLATFLPESAQAAIARVASHALVLRELLHGCGLRYSHHIRIHDGGPVLVAELDDLAGSTFGADAAA